MIRAAFTLTLLLAVLIQAVFGCLARHSHPVVTAADQTSVASDAHDHHHGHGKHHHHHAPPAPHFHFGGESGEEHQHEETGVDTESYVTPRLAASLIGFDAVGHIPFDITDDVALSAERHVRRERMVACGRSGWPSGQRLSLLGVWLI
jgi:hypothetical protein